MRSLDELDVSGKRVLLRLDLNVPHDAERITDDGKIRACLPTLRVLLDRSAAVIACSHLGRPAGPDSAFTLAPVAARLGQLIRRPVTRFRRRASSPCQRLRRRVPAAACGRVRHVSTGGGASLEYLEGKTLPGLAALQDD